MVDFKKKLQKAQVAIATDPKEIYATLHFYFSTLVFPVDDSQWVRSSPARLLP